MVDQETLRILQRAGVRAHPNWLAPDWVQEVVGPPDLDATQWVGRMAEAGIGSVLFVTKGHDGLCNWPTSLPAPHTSDDFLGEMCREGERSGVRVFAYYSMAIDDHQVGMHPDWAFVDRDGVGCEAIGFRWACLNSPYGALARAQIAEILAGYPVDAIWLDIYALGPRDRDCLCPWCRERYAQRHGGDLAAVTDPTSLGQWKVECLVEYLRGIREDRDRLRPAALLAFNGAGAGFRRHPEAGLSSLTLFDLVDFLSDEGHDPRFESATAKAMRAHGRPFEVLSSDGIANEWLGWVTKPPGLLSLEGSIVGSHGGSFGLGLSILPTGEMPKAELSVVAQATEFLSARAAWFGRQDPASGVRILIQPFRDAAEFVPPERPEPQPTLPRDGAHHTKVVYDPEPVANGLWDALREGHIPFDFIHEYRGLDGVSALMLQGSARLTRAYCEMVREFVDRGGVLIAEAHASLLDEEGRRCGDFQLGDVLGVRFGGYCGAWDANYIQLDAPELRVGLPDYPLLVTGPSLRVEATSASVLAQVVGPVGGEQTLTRHTAALYNPPGPPSGHPAITTHRYGRGQAIYLAQGIGSHIRLRRDVDPWTKRLVGNLVDFAGARPLRTTAPPGVELVLNRAPHGGLLLHLLNHYAASASLGPDGGPEIAPFRIELDESRYGRVLHATAEPGGDDVERAYHEPGWVTLLVPSFSVHQVLDIRVEERGAQ